MSNVQYDGNYDDDYDYDDDDDDDDGGGDDDDDSRGRYTTFSIHWMCPFQGS